VRWFVACRRAIAALATFGAPPDWAELMAAAAEGTLVVAILPASGCKRDGSVGSGGICSLLTRSRNLTSNLLTFRSSCESSVFNHKTSKVCRCIKYQSQSFLTQPQFLSLQNLNTVEIRHDDFGKAIFLWVLDVSALCSDKVLDGSVACVDDIAQILDVLVFCLDFLE
jgi:hypothetical protein